MMRVAYQRKMAKYFNTSVKPRKFDVRDLVFRDVTFATQNLTDRKLGPNLEGPYQVVDCKCPKMYHLETIDGKRLPHPWNVEHQRRYY